MPIFILILNREVSWDFLKKEWLDVIKSNAKALAYVFITAVLCFSPAVLAFPFGYKQFYSQSVGALTQMLFHFNPSPWPPPPGLFYNLKNILFPAFYHWSLLLVGLTGSVGLIVMRRKKSLDEMLIPLVGLISFAMILVVGYKTPHLDHSMRTYVLALGFIFAFVLLARSGWSAMTVRSLNA